MQESKNGIQDRDATWLADFLHSIQITVTDLEIRATVIILAVHLPREATRQVSPAQVAKNGT